MANYFSTSTVEPMLPAARITDEQLALLAKAGFSREQDGDLIYFFCEEGINDTDPETDEPLDWEGVFQEIALAARIPEIIAQGSWGCSKARPGEFGGYVTRITSDSVQRGCTFMLLEMMRIDPTFGI